MSVFHKNVYSQLVIYTARKLRRSRKRRCLIAVLAQCECVHIVVESNPFQVKTGQGHFLLSHRVQLAVSCNNSVLTDHHFSRQPEMGWGFQRDSRSVTLVHISLLQTLEVSSHCRDSRVFRVSLCFYIFSCLRHM